MVCGELDVLILPEPLLDLGPDPVELVSVLQKALDALVHRLGLGPGRGTPRVLPSSLLRELPGLDLFLL